MNFRNSVILIIIFIFLVACSTAQKASVNNMNKAFTAFMNSKEVINNFKEWNINRDSLLVIIDLNNISNGTFISKWQDFNVILLNKGPLVDSLKLFDANHLLTNRCNYFVLMSRKESVKVTVLALRHACTNVVSEVKIVERNRLFYLGKTENAVW